MTCRAGRTPGIKNRRSSLRAAGSSTCLVCVARPEDSPLAQFPAVRRHPDVEPGVPPAAEGVEARVEHQPAPRRLAERKRQPRLLPVAPYAPGLRRRPSPRKITQPGACPFERDLLPQLIFGKIRPRADSRVAARLSRVRRRAPGRFENAPGQVALPSRRGDAPQPEIQRGQALLARLAVPRLRFEPQDRGARRARRTAPWLLQELLPHIGVGVNLARRGAPSVGKPAVGLQGVRPG